MNSTVNILLVDDETRNLDVLESSLLDEDYRLVRASTAEQALLALIDGEFAAIVLDVRMPEMSGFELANMVKERKRTQHIPIIFLTAYFQEDKDVLEGYGAGAVDYLTKPINPQILKSKIAVFADLFRKTRALALTNATLEQEIGQRQKAEAALRDSNNELEARVEQRTAALQRANEELLAREAALGAREAQLRLVTDHAPVFIAQFDREHRFKFVNRTYARRFDLEPWQLVGKHFTEIMGEAPYVAIRHHIEAALEGHRVEFEAEIPYASLGPRWVFVIHEPERAPDGRVVGLVAVITDITERKRVEHDVILARDRALAASRAKDDFVARLSHELRTPLNPVLLIASDGATNPSFSPEVRTSFRRIAENVELEARLIDDLLDLTRVTKGKLTLELRPFDFQAAIHDAVGMVGASVAQKRIVLDLRLPPEQCLVVGDDVRLRQVFWNVLSNAVKFTPAGGVVTVEAQRHPANGHLTVRVSDTGIGMTTQELEHVFEAFSQGDHANHGGAHRFGGLGLGLAISRMLVEFHGGSIRAESPGRHAGATFWIELPLPAAETTLAAPGAAAAPPPEPLVGPPPARRRILLVEDHLPTSSALTHLLVRRGYEVVNATCATEARATVGRETFDLLISDLGLPDGTGYELMRELGDGTDLVGIALTGYGMDDDVNRSRAAGFSAHLTKPVRIQELDRTLQTVLPAVRPPFRGAA